jgi:hypothetical protein
MSSLLNKIKYKWNQTEVREISGSDGGEYEIASGI